MREYHSNEIGNVVVLGHLGSGKTSVIEAMVYRSKGSSKIGTIQEGSTISDYDHEEIKRHASINTTIIPVEWENCKINLLDTPGYSDFIGETLEAIKAADSALIIVPATSGITVGTKQAMARTNHLPRMIFINNLDDPNSAYHEKLEQLKKTFGKSIAPIQVPIIENNKMVGYVNVAKMEGRRFEGEHTIPTDIPENMWDEIKPIKEMIDEAVANSSDDLLDKYFNGEEFSREEISWALRQGVMNRTIIPVLCGTHNIGIQIILNSMVAFFPATSDTCNEIIVTEVESGEQDIIGYNESLPPSIFIFKTIADPFVGKISLFKVCTGVVHSGMSLFNVNKKEVEKLNKISIIKGKELIETDVLHAGDIGAISKLQYSDTNDTLCTIGYRIKHEPINFPKPYYTKAIKTSGKDNEERIANAINRLLDEDKTLAFSTNPETKQQLLSGIGDQHLDIIVSKLKSKFKIEVTLEDVILPYRETIKKSVTQRSKFKKQSGGHGQYGDVEITFEPSYDFTTPYIFEEKIFGGSVPKTYFPAVEKGIQESIKEGVLAKYPVIGLKVTLIDGSYHNVDSSEMAFKNATAIAYKEALPKANPVILEPYVTLKITVEESQTGDIMSDLNKKRARVIDMEHLESNVKITAEVPQNEVMNYAIDLKSITQGQGTFEMEFLDYEYAPEHIQKQIIESRK